jgi:DNA gyrase subunit A
VIRADQVDDVVPAEPEPMEIADDPCVVTLSTTGLLGREPADGVTKPSLGRHDVLAARVATTNHATVLAITDTGRTLAVTAMEVPEVAGRGRGAAASEVVDVAHGESVLTVLAPGEHPILLVTAAGAAKRLAPEELAGTRSGAAVISLKGDDRLVAALAAPDGAEVILVADDAQALRTAVDGVSLQGRGAAGVAGMKLKGGASVVGAGLAAEGAVVVTVTDAGTAKVTDAAEVPAKGRATGGVRLTRFKHEQRLVAAWVGPPDDLVAVVGQADNPTRPDPTPVPLPVPVTRRDTLSTATDERLLGVGPRRF